MNQIHKSTKRHPERGITLISLITTIIILVILTAIVVKTITGDNSLIGATTSATENYKIEQYKELISAEVIGTIQTDMIRGEKTTLESLAENIKKNVEGVVDATINQDETLNNKDILVTTEEGYIFQIIYDEETGDFKIEYGGKGDIEGLPRIVATYNKATSTIEATASISKGKIISLELIFNGESLKGDQGSTNEKLTRKIAESGLYQIKATADNGKTRSAYIRVTDIDGSIAAPNIEVTKGVMGQEGWYKSDLEITISLSGETATEIHYLITNSNSVADANKSETVGEDGFEVHKGNTKTIPITTLRKHNNLCICK